MFNKFLFFFPLKVKKTSALSPKTDLVSDTDVLLSEYRCYSVQKYWFKDFYLLLRSVKKKQKNHTDKIHVSSVFWGNHQLHQLFSLAPLKPPFLSLQRSKFACLCLARNPVAWEAAAPPFPQITMPSTYPSKLWQQERLITASIMCPSTKHFSETSILYTGPC